jgi:hypothetical protein
MSMTVAATRRNDPVGMLEPEAFTPKGGAKIPASENRQGSARMSGQTRSQANHVDRMHLRILLHRGSISTYDDVVSAPVTGQYARYFADTIEKQVGPLLTGPPGSLVRYSLPNGLSLVGRDGQVLAVTGNNGETSANRTPANGIWSFIHHGMRGQSSTGHVTASGTVFGGPVVLAGVELLRRAALDSFNPANFQPQYSAL